jgi:hypothetical protein
MLRAAMVGSSNFKLLLAAGAVAVAVYACIDQRSGYNAPRLPGAVVQGEPEQDDRARRAAFEHKGYRIEPFARFTVRARLLAAASYRSGREADLSPVDFALGWNDLSNDAVLDRLQISQGNRFYFYRWQGQPPVPPEVIVRNSANMHLIPASATVARALEQARPGAVVTLRGWLVDVSAPDGWQWRSSRTRTDSGAGACEVIWVEDVELGGSGV